MDFLISRTDGIVDDLKIIYKYNIGMCKVYITSNGQYIVQEPKISESAEKIYAKLMENVRLSMSGIGLSKENIIQTVTPLLEKEARSTGVFDVWSKERESIEYYLKRNLIGYREIDVLINDKYIEDILSVKYDKPITIIHNKFSNSALTSNVFFKSEENMSRLIHIISQWYGDPPSNVKPMTSFTNKDNVRFTFTGNSEITPDGCTISIRKPAVNLITIFNLIKDNILTTLSASYLWVMMDLKGFGLIIGAPSSGKTTLINAIFSMSNPKWHYFTIEDVLELRLPHSTVSKHQTRGINSFNQEDSKYSIGIFELCKLSLRFNPDFVIVGEVLGKEAEGLFQVASSGSGCISSFHASNPNDALIRLESPPINISKINTNLISYFLHISKIQRQNKLYRRILEITEPVPKYTNDTMTKQLCTIFTYDTKLDRLTVIPSNETDEIQRLVNRSQKLEKAKTVLGIDNMYADLKNRMSILQKIIDNNISNSNAISKEIFKYYER